MGKATYGTGTLFKRGRIWYVSYYVNGRQVQLWFSQIRIWLI